MPREEAMQHYLRLVNDFAPDWMSWAGNHWLATSLVLYLAFPRTFLYAQAQQAKHIGEAAQAGGDAVAAVHYFSACVLLDPENYIHRRHRAGALLAVHEYERALEDTERVVAAKPTWAKVR
jgi:hypothetical protein